MESIVVIINGKRLGRFALASCSQTELRLVSIPMAERPLADFRGVMSTRLWCSILNLKDFPQMNLQTIGDLANLTEQDVCKARNAGKQTFSEIRALLDLIKELELYSEKKSRHRHKQSTPP